ncbi:MAG: type II toxin-antitoxin system RatA family toxin [Pseudomonadota bacterium]
MRQVRRTALVAHSAEQMFDLVDDVSSYPEFLPWCSDAVEHERSLEEVHATLELNKGGVSKRFTTRNVRERGESLEMQLVDGPFSHLHGVWLFESLGPDGSKVSLNIDFEFANVMVGMMFGAFFEQTCNSLVDAFIQRADDVFGD